MKVAVSYLKSQKSKEETLSLLDKSQTDFIHVDLMDGVFVPENNLNLEETISLLKDCQKPLDIHLMVKEPIKIISQLSFLKPDYITIHVETSNVEECLSAIKKHQVRCGLAINPETKIETIYPYLEFIDQILVMSVHPGKGGQTFISDTVEKLKSLSTLKKEKNLSFLISVDGGINKETISLVKDYVDMVVSGSFVCMHDEYNAQINLLK